MAGIQRVYGKNKPQAQPKGASVPKSVPAPLRPPTARPPSATPTPVVPDGGAEVASPGSESPSEPMQVSRRQAPRKVTKCLYFAKGEEIDRLEKVIESYPNSSLSSVISQMVSQVVKYAKSRNEPGAERGVQIPTFKIYL